MPLDGPAPPSVRPIRITTEHKTMIAHAREVTEDTFGGFPMDTTGIGIELSEVSGGKGNIEMFLAS